MKTKNTDIIMQNRAFIWIALATGLILLVPFFAMQLSGEVSWDIADFITVGTLLSGMGSMFVLAARKVDQKYWPAVGITLAVALLLVWIELAVGIFGTPFAGS